MQYRLGMWDRIDSGTGAPILALLQKYTTNPAILDLGCGRSLNLQLAADKYRRYHGVDISSNSIRTARKYAHPNCTFEVGDVLRYDTRERFDAILLREILYYLPKPEAAPFLRRITRFLEPGGVVLVQFWDRSACAEFIDIVLNSGLRVLQDSVSKANGGPESTVIVLQSPALTPT